MRCVATWNDVTRAAPELAPAVQRRFEAHIHKTPATLRADGFPDQWSRSIFRDGELWLGMMPDSRKAKDLQRDLRLALHSATVDPEMPDGDAKLAGRAEEVTDQETFDWFIGEERAEKGQEPPQPFHLFRVDIVEIVLTTLGGDPPDHLVIETWRERRRGTTRAERR